MEKEDYKLKIGQGEITKNIGKSIINGESLEQISHKASRR